MKNELQKWTVPIQMFPSVKICQSKQTALGFGSLDELFEMLVLLQTKFLGKVGTVFFWSISMQL